MLEYELDWIKITDSFQQPAFRPSRKLGETVSIKHFRSWPLESNQVIKRSENDKL